MSAHGHPAGHPSGCQCERCKSGRFSIPAPAPSEPSEIPRHVLADFDVRGMWDNIHKAAVGIAETRKRGRDEAAQWAFLDKSIQDLLRAALSAAPVASPASEPSDEACAACEAATVAVIESGLSTDAGSVDAAMRSITRAGLRAAYAVDYRGAAPPSPETRDVAALILFAKTGGAFSSPEAAAEWWTDGKGTGFSAEGIAALYAEADRYIAALSAAPVASPASEPDLVAACATCGHARAYHARRVGPCSGGGDWCGCREFAAPPSPETRDADRAAALTDAQLGELWSKAQTPYFVPDTFRAALLALLSARAPTPEKP